MLERLALPALPEPEPVLTPAVLRAVAHLFETQETT
jgi:hypothetical protein